MSFQKIIVTVCFLLIGFQGYTAENWTPRVVNLGNYYVASSIPKKWKHIDLRRPGSILQMVEFLPPTETVKNWSKMITFLAQKDFSGSVKDYFTSHYLSIQKLCSKRNTAGKIYVNKELPRGSFLSGMIMCGKPLQESADGNGIRKNQGEIIAFNIFQFKGESDIYSLFHSWRGASFDVKSKSDKKHPASVKDIEKAFEILNKPRLFCHQKNPTADCKRILAPYYKSNSPKKKKKREV